MEVKTYRASGMRDALAKVKAELGPDAVILSTQRLDDGPGGHGGSTVEITAAAEHRTEPVKNGLHYFQRLSRGRAYWPLEGKDDPHFSGSTGGPASGGYDALDIHKLQKLIEPLMSEVRDLRALVSSSGLDRDAREVRVNELTPELAVGRRPTEGAGQKEWRDSDAPTESHHGGSFEELNARAEFGPQRSDKESVSGTGRTLSDLRRAVLKAQSPGQADSLSVDPSAQLDAWLTDADMAPNHRKTLVNAVRRRVGTRNRVTAEAVEGAFIEELVSRVRICSPQELDHRKVVAFVGPTGVGKTTTLAKTAAELTMDRGHSVGMITIDTYRIGAVEQLRKYASLLDVPFEVVVDRLTLEQALRRLEGCDVILIDTVGRSPRGADGPGMLRKLLSGIPGLELELCISATTSLRDMKGILANYRPLAPDHLLFTKLDETFAFGPMVSAHLDEEIPLSYFTIGQRVPDDMERASVERVVSLLIPVS